MELAIESAGASVISASSFDVSHPPKSIMEDTNTFWMSTGSFPQELILQLGEPSLVKSIDLVATGIRSIELSKCEGTQANTWESVCKEEAGDGDGDVQRLSLQVPPRLTATYLRVKIYSGWADYISIHRMSVLGQAGATRK
jgi:hypothetical protein